MKIVNFGSCNLDYVYRLHHIVRIGETEQIEQMETFPGGKGLNQSIALSKAGARVYHAGAIGKDGEMLLSTLRESGVDLTFLKTVEGVSGHAVIQVSEKGENAIFIHSGANAMLTKEYIDSVLSHFEKGDLVLLQNETDNVAYIISESHKKGMITFFNPSPIGKAIDEVDFGKVSCVILNEIEGEYLSGEKEPERIISAMNARYPQLKTVLTLGEKGCMYHDGNTLYYHSAYEVPVVDSTAAGDAFMGYFIASVSGGASAEKAIETACAASALVVSRKGAAPSIPYMKEVAEAIKVLKPKDTGYKNTERQLLSKIERYLSENLPNACLAELASELGYSPVYAGHIVRKLTGKPFSVYLQKKRCSVAAEYLLKTDLSVAEVIDKVGYSNETFFRNKFKELYGLSPAAYRRALKNV